MDVDWGRGGFGHIKRQALAERQAALLHQHRMYGEGQDAEAAGGEALTPAAEAAGPVGGSRTRAAGRGSPSDDEARVKRRRRSESDSDD